MSELKDYDIKDIPSTRAYIPYEVDKMIAEKDEEIRKLQRALWIAHEYKAKFKRWWLHLALDCEAREIRPNTKTINRIKGKIRNCEKSERKCRAMAEEYK